MTEHSQLESDALDYLRTIGYKAWRTHSARLTPIERGIPDIMGVKAGQMVAIEIKAGKDKQSQAQHDFCDCLIRQGVNVVVARTLDHVMERIK
jgi:Holliday junction resolvase